MSRSDRFSRAVFAALALASLGVLAVAVVRRPESLIFYVAPTGGLLVSVAAFRLAESARVNLALSLITMGIAVYAAESVLLITEQGRYDRTFENEDDRIREARRQGVPYDRRTRLEVVEDLRAEGTPAVARLHPSSMIDVEGLSTPSGPVYPMSGISDRPTVTCNESGTWTLIQSDEHGFRNPRGLYTVDSVDVVVVGDSYAFGDCVPAGDGPVEALRRAGHRVLNLGYGGSGPLIELAALVEYGRPFSPRDVVWFYYEGNDLQDLRHERTAEALLAYLDPGHSQGLLDRREELDRLRLAFHDEEHEAALRQLAEGRTRRLRCAASLCGLRDLVRRSGTTATPQRPDLPVDFLIDVVRAARDRVEAWGGRFHFVYVPAWGRYARDVDQDAFNDRRRVLDLLGASGIEVIDFAERLLDHPDPLALFPYRARGHFTAEGYALLAAEIAARLEPAPAAPR